MAPTTAAALMVRAAAVAVLLLQCFNVILAARPLLDAAAGDGRRPWLGRLELGGAGTPLALIMQVLHRGPCPNNNDWQAPNGSGCP
jgi:hypothetical protein